jgi:tetratricopeptide (TPR) repeat protein
VPVVAAPRFPEFVKPVVPIELSGDRAVGLFSRGWQFLQAGDLENAGLEFATALRVSPGFPPAETGAGYVELARQNAGAALPHFERALERNRDDASALVGRGEALMALGREPEAVASLEAAVNSNPALVDVRRRLEVLRFRSMERELATAREAARGNRLDEAIRAYRSAIASSPDSAFLYREVAAIERRAGDADGALQDLTHAIALDSSDGASHASIGELLEERGDFDGAAKAYRQSLAVESSEAVEARLAALEAKVELARMPEQYRAIETAAQATRGDLAALIGVRLAGLLMSMPPGDPGVMTDVLNNWAEPWIMAVATAGVMEPFANHTFQPGTAVQRVDLAVAVSRLLAAAATPAERGRWESVRPTFPDVAPTHLAYPSVAAAVASGVLPTGPDGSFEPSRPVSGAEAVDSIERLQAMANGSRGAR